MDKQSKTGQGVAGHNKTGQKLSLAELLGWYFALVVLVVVLEYLGLITLGIMIVGLSLLVTVVVLDPMKKVLQKLVDWGNKYGCPQSQSEE